MKASFRGDAHVLKGWANKAQRFSRDALEFASLQLAEQAIELVRDGISRGRDPYGRRYRRLVFRKGQPLRDTGRLQASWHRKRSGPDGFTIAASAKYAIYHQIGTGIYGPRKSPIVPNGGSAAFRRRSLAKLSGTGERVGFGKALRIPTPGGAIFRRSVKGSPRRAMVPYQGLPASWRRAFTETIHEALTAYFED